MVLEHNSLYMCSKGKQQNKSSFLPSEDIKALIEGKSHLMYSDGLLTLSAGCSSSSYINFFAISRV